MALRGFDSGEATKFPTYASRVSSAWSSVANQPSRWQVKTGAYAASMGVDTTDPFYGTTHFHLLSATDRTVAMRRHFAATPAESYISFVFKLDALVARDVFQLTTAAATPVTSMRIHSDASGNILVYAATTLKKTIVTGWGANTWHQIRIHQKTSDNTLEVILDNGAIEDCSGTAMLPWYFLVLGNPNNNTTATSHLYIDAIQVNDTTGSVNNSWPDSPRIPTAIRPDGDTASTDWARSSGSNDSDMIKEEQPDLDTTYVSSSNIGDASRYTFGNLAEPSNAVIVGVCLTIVAKRADAAKIIPVVSRGGTTVELTAVDVETDYMSPIEVIIEQDPIAVGAWTQTNLNATEFGIKHASP